MSVTVANFPILSSENADYRPPASYEIKEISTISAPNSKLLEHKISGQNLVGQLLIDQRATFCCNVSAPRCSFKSTIVPEEKLLYDERTKVVQQRQSVQTETSDYAPPVTFQPLVVTTEAIHEFKLLEQHGVDDLWVGSTISMPRGAIIAQTNHYSSRATLQSILSIQVDNEQKLPEGSFEVSGIPEKGFYFNVKVAKDLFEQLKSSEYSAKHKTSIYCFALSQGLDKLANDPRSSEVRDNWREYANLKQLYQELRRNRARTWDEADFEANSAVAHLVKHDLESDHMEGP